MRVAPAPRKKSRSSRHALDTVQCYAKIQGYTFLLFNDSSYDCRHKDHFFRRHCVVSKTAINYDFTVFIDADIGVVNPNRRIEEFLDDSKDLIFYDRFWNWEVAMGSYIVRNTSFAREALMDFANYDLNLPKSFYGNDNGIINRFLVKLLFPNAQIAMNDCEKMFNKSENFNDVSIFEACFRTILGASQDFGKVRIIRKGHGWVRDHWLDNSKWNPDLDFMLHDWKEGNLNETPENVKLAAGSNGGWYNPLAGPIDLDKCGPLNSTWEYDPRLIADKSEMQENHRNYEIYVNSNYIQTLAKMEELKNRPVSVN
ncbi:unnamed protein product [Caenorhabditis angaria]|uniref:Nucleotide-diphospho-sugar transferase domain-containing protein n=1 Tax=Caenorhabditis angaria TaxID=860376 RepID=A0A9P1IW70_9PELO|nr:unnamed protein product [Caenorhabditis angaria]